MFLFPQEELKPEAFSLGNDFDVECLVDVCVLLLDEIVKVMRLVVELELPPERVLQLPELVDELQDDAQDDQVEERQLNNQQTEVANHCQ